MPTFISRFVKYDDEDKSEGVTIFWQFVFNIFGGFLASILFNYLQYRGIFDLFLLFFGYSMFVIIPMIINRIFQVAFIKTQNRFIHHFVPLLLLQLPLFFLYSMLVIFGGVKFSLNDFFYISISFNFPLFVSALICISIEHLYKKQQFAIHNNNILDDNFINNKPDVNNE